MNSEELIQKLEEYYQDLLKQKEIDGDMYLTHTISYFNFIDQDQILRNIADFLFLNPSSPGCIRNNIKSCYYRFCRGDVTERISLVNCSTSDIRTFHRYILERASLSGLKSKRTVILYIKTGENRIFLERGDPGYFFKGNNPNRFKIVLYLNDQYVAKSAREIANFLGKNGSKKTVQDNIKKEIERLNINFKKKCKVKDNLITEDMNKGKKTYSLNKKIFFFKLEK